MKLKRMLAIALAVVTLCASVLTGCGSKEENKGATGETVTNAEGIVMDESKTVKMGVLVSDATTAEALAFRSYYEQYIQKQYNVQFMYSDELADASAEASAIDNFIANNCKAVISFSSFDRPAQLTQCADAGVYYAVATGTLSEEQYETVKTNEYYVGAIGPDLMTEYQTGYDMAKYFLDNGKTKFAIFGGAIPYYADMHIFRAAGMLSAMCEAGRGDYKGASDMQGIVNQIYADGEITTGAIGSVEVVGYVGGYDMDDAWFGKCAAMAQTPGLETILAVGNGSDFFGAAKGDGVTIGSVDAYADAYKEAMEAGSLNYLAGKFSASIGPIFMATYSAVQGHPIRNAEGNALALSQGYWIADSAEEFNTYYAVDSSVEEPAYTREMLDKLFAANYEDFAAFVGAYSFDDIQTQK